MPFSDNLVNTIHDKILLSDYIGRTVNLSKKGNDFIGLCPFHNEKTPSFNVSSNKQFYHCFGCGASGDAIKFLTEHDHLTFIEALSKLAQAANIEMPDSTKKNDTTYNLFISNKKPPMTPTINGQGLFRSNSEVLLPA